ncbi:sugar phosphate isomerase/epimerase family protein [Methanogenium organophilum]|uniref:Sugar phosphate isomerase/epimerase n=1 Tax=Methanogenium organophilum TaxID=2199 RepID=A0A9X9T7Q6_METOG|nr:sugar phosphate isomerase/epimerase family protein [Methanogenium organophilum]WAI00940.1 sugar phosphate isomerase/epimerase [Methanogenium organophilum]
MTGISTSCLHERSLEEALEILSGMTDFVEIIDDGPHYCQSPEVPERYSFRYSLHAPSRGVNVASTLEPIRRASVEVVSEALTIAGELNANVVIHPGYCAWAGGKVSSLRALRHSLDEIAAVADDTGVTFFVENMPKWPYFFFSTPEDYQYFDNCNICLDTGHAFMTGTLDSFLSLPFEHCHIHDNDGTEDSHSPVGSGGIDWDTVLGTLAERKVEPVLEVRSVEAVRESLATLKRFGF